MYRILILALALLIPCAVVAQEEPPPKLDKYEKRDLIEGLRAPASYDRLRAALKLQKHITKEDIELMLFGDEIKYKDKTVKIEPDLLALSQLLRGGWPKALDDYVDDIYEIEDEAYVPAFAYDLFKYGKLSRIDEDLPICEPWLRDEYYNDYVDRMSYSWLWRDKYIHLGSKEWLKKRFIEDKDVDFRSKHICRLLAGEDVSDEDIDGHWTKYLKEAIKTNKNPGVTGTRVYTIIGTMDCGELVAILLDKPEWLPIMQDELSNYETRRFDPFKGEFYTVKRDCRNKVIGAMIACVDGDIKKTKEILTPVLMNVKNAYTDVDLRVILHHPFFFRLRGSAGFVEWWKDNCQVDIVDPDPEFKALNWR